MYCGRPYYGDERGLCASCLRPLPEAPPSPTARIVREGQSPPYKDHDEFKDRCWSVFYILIGIATGFMLGVVWWR